MSRNKFRVTDFGHWELVLQSGNRFLLTFAVMFVLNNLLYKQDWLDDISESFWVCNLRLSCTILATMSMMQL
jgi:hypothetical protein